MTRLIRRFSTFLVLGLWVAALTSQSFAGQPAYYHPNADRLFWFMLISDTHIGAAGSQTTDFLNWAVSQARTVIAPQFIVNTGALTDSTNGGFYPNGPFQAEWNTYRSILDNAGIDASNVGPEGLGLMRAAPSIGKSSKPLVAASSDNVPCG